MRILINTPALHLLGGVANHYLGLKPFWTETVRYNTVGKRTTKSGNGVYWLAWDICKFFWQLCTFRPNAILLNPSLGRKALARDFIFLRIARIFGFKVGVFIHGFDWQVAKSINHQWIERELNQASVVFVLAKSFAEELRSWGVKTPIVLTTTKVDDRMIEKFDIATRTGQGNNLLFLSRIEKTKGIYEAIETYAILKKQYPELKLTITGDGSELPKVRALIAKKALPDIIITGALSGDALIQSYKSALLLLLLTSYGEGMPTVVLEGMAFGLPIITRNVGGIPDFFENDKMGFISDSLDPQVYANAISRYLDDQKLTANTAHYNHEYAKTHFMASHIAISIESALKQYCSK